MIETVIITILCTIAALVILLVIAIVAIPTPKMSQYLEPPYCPSFGYVSLYKEAEEIRKNKLEKQEEEKAKYFVFNPAADKPKKVYETYEEAFNDAKSVSSNYNADLVYVLKTVASIEREGVIRKTTTDRYGNKQVEIEMAIPF